MPVISCTVGTMNILFKKKKSYQDSRFLVSLFYNGNLCITIFGEKSNLGMDSENILGSYSFQMDKS